MMERKYTPLSQGKATLRAAKIETIDPDAPVDLSLPEETLYIHLLAKYGKQINDLDRLDHRFWERRERDGQLAVLRLLERIRQHRDFGKSVPPIDLIWILELLKVFRMEEIRQELNKAALWLASNPERKKKNYRKFLTGWLSRAQQKQEIHYHVKNE